MLYLAAFAIVFAVNLMPAFGPPTWAVLVLLKLDWHLNTVALVLVGACAAGAGRYLLGLGSYAVRGRLSDRRRANLAAAQQYVTGHRSGAALGLGLFALSPLPSAQLFEAAGVLALPLLPLTVAFFAGRIVSYSLYVSAADIAQRNYGDLFTAALTSPVGIAVQVLMLAGIVALTQIDWARLLRGRNHNPNRQGS